MAFDESATDLKHSITALEGLYQAEAHGQQKNISSRKPSEQQRHSRWPLW